MGCQKKRVSQGMPVKLTLQWYLNDASIMLLFFCIQIQSIATKASNMRGVCSYEWWCYQASGGRRRIWLHTNLSSIQIEKEIGLTLSCPMHAKRFAKYFPTTFISSSPHTKWRQLEFRFIFLTPSLLSLKTFNSWTFY